MSEILDILDASTGQRLKALGDLRAESLDLLAQRAIQRYLDEEEVYEQEKAEDMRRLAEYRRTGKFVSQERMDVWLRQLAQGKRMPCPEAE